MGGIVVDFTGAFMFVNSMVNTCRWLDVFLKVSHIWRQVLKLTLNTNIRIHVKASSAAIFSKYLIDLGDDKALVDSYTEPIPFPCNFCKHN